MKIVFCGLMVLLAACSRQTPRTDKTFDFDGFFGQQASRLSEMGAVLGKTATLREAHQDTTFLPTEAGWKLEWELAQELETLNKPAYRQTYRVRDSIKDEHSNLLIREYTSTESPLRSVRFYYQGEFSKLKRVEAQLISHHLLYNSYRHLAFTFEEDEQQPLLERYQLDGYEKMMFRDSTKFSISGTIDW